MKPDISPYRSEAHRALADRELKIGEAYGHLGHFKQLAKDRRQRWAALLADREESADVRTWATDMAILHGVSVRLYRTSGLNWITALYVVRYGEAEDFWPDALGADDMIKAQRWFRGNRPDGIVYLSEE